MITKVIEIELLPANRVVTRPVHQWDIGQIIKVTDADIEDGTPVDFGNRFMQGGLRAYMIGSEVTIPAPALQQERDLTAYVVVTDENSETTVKEIRIPVIPRPKPEDYVDEEIRESTEFQYVLGVVEEVEANAKAAAEAAGKAAESETAARNSETAAAASEKKASGAATTATNKATEAGNSAAAAQNAKNAAEQAKTDAEAARDAAKTSEENAKTHQGSAEEAATKAALIEANIEEAYHEISNLENQMMFYYKGAETKASEASGSAESALASKNAAAESETNAGQSAKNAADSETAAKAAQRAAEAARDEAAVNKQAIVEEVLAALPTWEGGSY